MAELTPDEEQDIVALVDGRLAPERRVALDRRAHEDPGLAAAIARQRVAVDMVAGAVQQVSAPLALRAAVERVQSTPERRSLRERLRRRGWRAPIAVAVAVAGALAIVVLQGGAP